MTAMRPTQRSNVFDIGMGRGGLNPFTPQKAGRAPHAEAGVAAVYPTADFAPAAYENSLKKSAHRCSTSAISSDESAPS